MLSLPDLFDRNRAWAEALERDRPGFFAGLAQQQNPDILWIGCADSRVPANVITGLEPGEVFVHRNVANVVAHSDLNALSVLQYAVEVLKVEHVVVCGHYGCGGVAAALTDDRLGLIDNWLLHVKDVAWTHRDRLQSLDGEAKTRRLCELNVIEQVAHVAETAIVRGAWEGGQSLQVHGWIYDLADGRLRDLGISVGSLEAMEGTRTAALKALDA